MVETSLQAKLEAKLKKAAFEKIDARFKEGKLSDPITSEAWKIYESMKDPLDKFFTISDEGIDRIVDEVVICAVTMPLSMGAGPHRGGPHELLFSSEWQPEEAFGPSRAEPPFGRPAPSPRACCNRP
jgi:hypothetical protein